MTEKDKMLSGEFYDPNDEELIGLRIKAHRLSAEYNMTFETEEEKRKEILRELFPEASQDIYLQGPIQVDYGCFTYIGERTYANFNLTILDICPVRIKWQERNLYEREDGVMTDKEYGKPITIENNCWIGGNVTICGGVTIGDGCVIGAGSVVTRDIPANTLAAGNPCKVIREI